MKFPRHKISEKSAHWKKRSMRTAGRKHTHDTGNGRFPQLRTCGGPAIHKSCFFLQHADSCMKIMHDWAIVRACWPSLCILWIVDGTTDTAKCLNVHVSCKSRLPYNVPRNKARAMRCTTYLHTASPLYTPDVAIKEFNSKFYKGKQIFGGEFLCQKSWTRSMEKHSTSVKDEAKCSL